MLDNQPVTQNEYILRDNQSPISRTDAKGCITYANADFCEASGFSEDELLGKAHNLVRHPDMPPEAFADMWHDLPLGLTWTGMVKNRRKNGDFYWVWANVSPIWEHGRIVGYASVRMKPERSDVAPVAAIYRQFRTGQARGLRISHGAVVHTGILGVLERWYRPNIRRRLILLTALAATLQAIVGWMSWMGVHAVTGSVLGIGLITWVGWSLQRSVVHRIGVAVDISKQIAAGYLANRMDTRGTDEAAQLMNALYAMQQSLASMAHTILTSSDSVRQEANRISKGNEALAGRTEEQARSLQETAKNMDAVAAKVQQNTAHANSAYQLVQQAGRIVTDGGTAVGKVVGTMDSIASSSRRITDIIGVIDGIAFQTNILALNAAVEAARAGEQGRGFAVVASEVRLLASRSASAAREIKSLIEDSVKKVEDGLLQVGTARKTIDSSIMAVGQVASLMEEIVLSSKVQGEAIVRVAELVTDIDGATRQNVPLAESAAESARALELQGYELVRSADVFRLG